MITLKNFPQKTNDTYTVSQFFFLLLFMRYWKMCVNLKSQLYDMM